MDLTEFLRARLDEDEAAARAATPGGWATGGLPWSAPDVVSAPGYRPEGFSQGQQVAECIVADGGMGPWAADVRGSGFPKGNAVHIARHDPDRVLREVAAKRAILALHRPESGGDCSVCSVCLTVRDRWKEDWPLDPWPCATLRHLAAVWADHPEFRQEWQG